MEFVDYYKVMGVAEDATADDIKRAYRKLARKYHPDVSTESDSEEKFKEVAEAYQVLKDPEKRQEYDELKRYGPSSGPGYSPPPGWQGSTGFDHASYSSADAGQFSDFFEEIFGQNARRRQSQHRESNFSVRGQDLHSKLTISIHDAFNGNTIPIELGRPAVQPDGSIRSVSQTVKVKIPKGVIDGQTIRLRGQGGPAIGDAPVGDLYIDLSIAEHAVFRLKGKDVLVDIPVTPWELALGASVVVPTLGGDVNLSIPANSEAGKKLRLKGRGMPGTQPGDQYAVLEVVVPPATTDEQRQLYNQMETLWSFNPRENLGSTT